MNLRPDGNKDNRRPASNALWRLRLYVNGRWSLKTLAALENIEELCETYLAARYELEVVDLVEDFARAEEDHVIALPTLVRLSPLPVRKVIGELSNRDQVIVALGLPASVNLL